MYRTAGMFYPRFADLPKGSRYPVNLMNYNLHIFNILSDERLRELTQGKYTIGNWVWEMPKVPDAWLDQFDRVDEAWVPSSFTKGIFATTTDLPTTVIPHPIAMQVSPEASRGALGIPEKRYAFLFTFSVGSGDGRKNPWGVIEAFKRAFGKPDTDDAPLLILKTQHSDDYPDLMQALREGIQSVNGLLLDGTYTRHQMNDLLALVDVYVSLHRAEGFGLGMAEAMGVGTPVIATAYSGNLDYMTPENGYLIDYNLRPVVKEDHRYRPDLIEIYAEGLIWADANLDQAADIMRHVYENPDEAREKGRLAQIHMEQYFSPYVVGAKMVERIITATELAQGRV
jgi:glycosyltransferase involved in cell wall biosynthesis